MVWAFDEASWQVPTTQALLNNETGVPPVGFSGSYMGAEPWFRYARPASGHGTTFVAAIVDGSAREISDDMEYRVY